LQASELVSQFAGGTFPKTRNRRRRAGWDAIKKSLDAASKVVNPKLFRGIKALSPARFKAARPVQNDSIIGSRKETAEIGQIFPQLFVD
jgi:hypothetical protein